MGLEALYIIEVKTRLIELGKELDAYVAEAEEVDGVTRAAFESHIEDFRERFEELEESHDLLTMFDPSEWGSFRNKIDVSLRKLSHDVAAARAELRVELVPA